MDKLKQHSSQLVRHLSSGADKHVRTLRDYWLKLKNYGLKKLCGRLLHAALWIGGLSFNPAHAITKDEEIAQKVFAIISYSKWDTQQQPLQLCIAGNSKFTEAIEVAGQAAYWPRVNVTKPHFDAKLLGSQCDVVFFGNISPAQQQSVLAARQNRPLLTIADSNSDCEIGSSFCLEPENSPVSFKVNLDSLTRSGIYVNPNVLLLGRKKTTP